MTRHRVYDTHNDAFLFSCNAIDFSVICPQRCTGTILSLHCLLWDMRRTTKNLMLLSEIVIILQISEWKLRVLAREFHEGQLTSRQWPHTCFSGKPWRFCFLRIPKHSQFRRSNTFPRKLKTKLKIIDSYNL